VILSILLIAMSGTAMSGFPAACNDPGFEAKYLIALDVT
jgi:hypothetical protein